MAAKKYNLGIFLILFLLIQGCSKESIKQELGLQKPFMDADLQQEGDSVIIKKAYLDKPGYIALFVTEYGKSGDIVGVSELFEGEKSDLFINLKNVKEGMRSVMVKMYYDNGDGIFDPSKGDIPIDIKNSLSEVSCTPTVSSC